MAVTVFTSLIWTAIALIGSSQSIPQKSSISTNEALDRCRPMEFNLYTKKHPQRYNIDLANVDQSIKNSSMDFKKQTKFISYPHELQRSDLNFTKIIETIIDKLDANVIVVEWPLLLKRSVSPKDLLNSREYMEGICFARLLRRLSENLGADSSKFHLIAYGSKVPVFVLATKTSYPFEVRRLTGLSPVADNVTISFFQSSTTRERGSIFVDMIYTNLLPNEKPVDFGHVSFFPNGGLHPQAGVSESQPDLSSLRSLHYLIESIERPKAFRARKCESWSHFVASHCTADAEEETFMGEYVSTQKRGNFYLYTNEKSPYGLE